MSATQYRYSSRWRKLSEWLKARTPEFCTVDTGEEIVIVLSDTQLVGITGSVDSMTPLPLGMGKYSITERARAAGFNVSNLDTTPAGLRIKVFRRSFS